MANLIPKSSDFMIGGNRFFDDFFGNLMHNDNFNVDLKENKENYEIKADLPGFTKENIKVDYDRDVLTIEAYRENQTEDKDEAGKYIRRERSTSSYQRQFVLRDVDETKINAKFEEGVLQLVLPKTAKNNEDKKYIEIN